MKRNLTTWVLASAVAGAAALATLAPATAQAGDDKCTTKKFHFKAVEKACESGGRKAAKDVMKAAVKKAKAAGKDMKCKSCHEDTKEFKLKDEKEAVEKLKPYI